MSRFICNHLNVTTKLNTLCDITFSLDAGSILGIVSDANSGAELLLQTVLKGLNAKETILLDNIDFCEHSETAKQQLAFVLGNCPFSMSSTANENASLYGSCYEHWDLDTFTTNCNAFGVPTDQQLKQLSADECIRFQLAFALAYDAKVYVFQNATEQITDDTKQLLTSMILELKQQSKIILYFSNDILDYDNIVDHVLWLDKGKQLNFSSKADLLKQFQMIRGSEKQLRYIQEQNPNLFLVTHILPNNGEALIQKTMDALPLQLESRTPTLHELVALQTEYYKANRSYFIEKQKTATTNETTQSVSHKIVNTADAKITKPSTPTKKQWNHIKWDEPKKRDDFWDQSNIEDSRTHKEHYENPFN